MNSTLKWIVGACLLSSLTNIVFADDATDTALIEKGRYIATTSDCAACHNSPNEAHTPFAGGYAIASPLGSIIASNITPSKNFGIGNYTEAEFAKAIRKGITPDGQYLYPAMPYTAYSGMTDADVKALYAYFMHEVKPVDEAPKHQTDLGFPFNIRSLMAGWNMLFANGKPYTADVNASDELARGKYLVDALGHCSTCHTPRNAMMAEDHSQYLSGAPLSGWYAPNITSDKASGIGDWSKQDIVTYLKTGHLANKAQAAGPMAEAVENSLRFMTDKDLNAMATYLKEVPAIKTATAVTVSAQPLENINQVISGQGSQKSLADSTTLSGAVLYDSACASCHTRKGNGTEDHFYPSLGQNTAVTSALPNNLVMAIANGVSRKGNEHDVLMPDFGHDMSNAQIAAVSNYVRLHFAHIDDKLTAENVAEIRSGGQAPFLLRHINGIMIIALLIVMALVGTLILRRRR